MARGQWIRKDRGPRALKELRTLYLRENCIGKIEGLGSNEHLDTLNLSQNLIKKARKHEPLEETKDSHGVQNKLSSIDDVEHVQDLADLTTLDVQQNNIEDPAVMDVFEKCAELRCLPQKGNPCNQKIKALP